MLIKEYWDSVALELFGEVTEETLEKARPVAERRMNLEKKNYRIAVVDPRLFPLVRLMHLGCPNGACPLNVQDSDCDGNFGDCQMNADNYPDNLDGIETPSTRAWIPLEKHNEWASDDEYIAD